MHSIRLRGPWQLEPVYRYVRQGDGEFKVHSEGLPSATTQKMPADWSAAFGRNFLGRVRYSRTFHAPPGLVPEERVWLVVEPQRSLARVVMVDETLGIVGENSGPQRFDITHRLSEVNQVHIFVDHPVLVDGKSASTDSKSLTGGLIGEVRLEIEE